MYHLFQEDVSMKKQLTTLSLLSLFAFNTPALLGSKKQEPITQQEMNDEDSWEAIFDNMNQSMYRMQRKMAQDFDNSMQTIRAGINIQAMPSLQFSSNDNELSIEVNGLGAKDVDIKADKDRLLIKAPEATIDVTTEGSMLYASMTRESKEETSNKNAKSFSSAMSQSTISQTIRHAIDLSKTKAQFDEKENRLTLTIPFAVKTPTQQIPVEVVGKPVEVEGK